MLIENLYNPPLIALLCVVVACSLLGVFVIWQKLSFFSDALSHSIFLALALAMILETNNLFVLIIFAAVFAIFIGSNLQSKYFQRDSLTMIVSYFCLACASIIGDFWAQDFHFEDYIFGDIFSVQKSEILLLFSFDLLIIFYFIFAFHKILLININSDIARVEGINAKFWDISFLFILSLMIALTIKIIGVFLMTALLIMPAAIARFFAKSPKQMVGIALLISIIISFAAFNIANINQINVSSLVVVAFFLMFLLASIVKKFLKS